MKKILILAMVIVSAFVMNACTFTHKCDWCMQKPAVRKYKNAFDTVVYVCGDCNRALNGNN